MKKTMSKDFTLPKDCSVTMRTDSEISLKENEERGNAGLPAATDSSFQRSSQAATSSDLSVSNSPAVTGRDAKGFS